MSKIPPKVIDAGLEVAEPLRVKGLGGGGRCGGGVHVIGAPKGCIY